MHKSVNLPAAPTKEELLKVAEFTRSLILCGRESYKMCVLVCVPLRDFLREKMNLKVSLVCRDFWIVDPKPGYDLESGDVMNHVWI